GPDASAGDAARPGSTGRGTSSETAANASGLVRQFSHAKLPDATSDSCVTTTSPAANEATGCGAKSRSGTTSCTTWFAATSTLCNGLGSAWKKAENGPGIGWVSWW